MSDNRMSIYSFPLYAPEEMWRNEVARYYDFVFSDEIQLVLDRLAIAVSQYGKHLASSKCKILLQEWSDLAPVLTVRGVGLELVDKFAYLGSCISAAGMIDNEVYMCTSKARLVFRNLRHLWRRRGLSRNLKSRV